MKKITILLGLALLFASAGLFAQDLRNNPDYKKGMEQQALAKQAYDAGDYDKSAQYSASAQSYFQKAKEYADLMALRFTASNLKNRVQDRFRYADSINAQKDYPLEYAAAQAAFQKANDAYAKGDYNTSITGYQALLEMAKGLAPKAPEPAAELAKADNLRQAIATYGLASYRPADNARGDDAYGRGKGLIGTDNGQAKLNLNEAIKYYQSVIDNAIAALTAKRRAELAEAKKRADSVNAGILAPDSYGKAQQRERSAESNLFAGNWDAAWADSEDALAAYRASYDAAIASGKLKPEFYTVRLIPHKRDCLWRISGYDFVYGDPNKWRLLYDENKHLLPNPKNPRLIEPGIRLRIPSLPGEVRAGEYQPKK